MSAMVVLILWGVWVLGAALAALQVHRLVARFRREPPAPLPRRAPRAWVIVPFRGVDADLAGCVASLCRQEYPDYGLVLVVDSEADPALAVLRAETARHPQREAEILVAGAAADTESQKIHNQLYALERLEKVWGDQDLVVFADSDAVPGPDWLRELVWPLRDPQMGVSTGYRWLVPIGAGADGAGRPTLWSHLASVMNSSVACVWRGRRMSRAWGGAMAMRVALARQAGLRGYLRGALTDDYQVTRLCRDRGLRVWFQPRCLAPTPVHFTLAGLLSFARRQYVITRVYEPLTFLQALAALSLWVAGFGSAVGLLAYELASRPREFRWIVPACALAAVSVLDQVRAARRRAVVRTAFGEATLRRLRATLYLDQWLTPVWMGLHWLLIVAACAGRTLQWRGLRYRLEGPQRVRRLP